MRRTFAADIGAVVYELTPDGEELFQAMVPLMRRGRSRMGDLELEGDRDAIARSTGLYRRVD